MDGDCGDRMLILSSRSQQQTDSANKQGFLLIIAKRILVDSPPATTSTDGLAISSKVDGVVLVVEAEKTRWPVAETVRDRIKSSGGNILGIVLNKRRYYIPEWIYKKL